jgi:hypothetical protein
VAANAPVDRNTDITKISLVSIIKYLLQKLTNYSQRLTFNPNGCKLQLRGKKLHERQISANADSQVLRQVVSQTGQPLAELAHKLHQSTVH